MNKLILFAVAVCAVHVLAAILEFDKLTMGSVVLQASGNVLSITGRPVLTETSSATTLSSQNTSNQPSTTCGTNNITARDWFNGNRLVMVDLRCSGGTDGIGNYLFTLPTGVQFSHTLYDSICANEGGTCACHGTVYYGMRYVDQNASPKIENTFDQMTAFNYRTKNVSGSVVCGIAGMGGDPLSGKAKNCFCTGASVHNAIPISVRGMVWYNDKAFPAAVLPVDSTRFKVLAYNGGGSNDVASFLDPGFTPVSNGLRLSFEFEIPY
jgi:hypothetical protein